MNDNQQQQLEKNTTSNKKNENINLARFDRVKLTSW